MHDTDDLADIPLTPELFDHFLVKGWFRMVNRMFTTDMIFHDTDVHEVIWARFNLQKFEWTKSHQKLLKPLSQFKLKYHNRCYLTQECERVYELYKSSVSFEAPKSIEDFLFGQVTYHMYFNTHTFSLYDQDLLIGRGYFDLGKEAAAGIMNFYHPNYKKYSLGRALFLLKIKHCLDLGMRYFYPGYVSPTLPHFDYKTSIHPPSTELYDFEADEWIPLLDRPSYKKDR